MNVNPSDEFVTKRNGNLEPRMPLKQNKAIDWSCEGIEGVDPELVKRHISSRFINKMKTSDLHDEHILSAAGLISEENPNYTYVAAKALLQKIFKEVTDGPCHYIHLSEYFENAIHHEQINPDVVACFDLEYLNKHIRAERDYNFKFQGLKTLYDRYFVRESIKYVQSPKVIELPQHFYMRVAMGLTYVESEETRHELCVQAYDIFSQQEWSNGTPTLFNTAHHRSQLSSCYLSEVPDDLGGIYDLLKDTAFESKWAGGCGSSWTRVRSAGSPIVGTNGTSNGCIPFLKLYNNTAIAVNQCFTGNTQITTHRGHLRIDEVREGDQVLTHDNTHQTVTKVICYEDYNGYIVKLKTSAGEVTVTPEHPVLVIQHASYKSDDQLRQELRDKVITAKWVDAKDITDSDVILRY